MTFVVLGLGSNRSWKGMDSMTLLRSALQALSPLLQDMCLSSIYRSRPMYVEDQSDFYNMAAGGWLPGELSPRELLDKIHEIEASLGRDRSREVRNGPRSIDIDIELFGSARVEETDLEIPHPRLQERAFVLVPLFEVLEKAFGRGAGAAAVEKALGTEIYSFLQRARSEISMDGISLLKTSL